MPDISTFTAFVGDTILSTGPLDSVLPTVKEKFDKDRSLILIFDNESGKQVDFELRGSLEGVLAMAIPAKGPGRPKLGVVSREISLLPRHWEWLEQQPSGASAAIRRLVDDARKNDSGKRQAQAATGRFLTAMAGDRPGYEEATRALYSGNGTQFEALIGAWPQDVRTYAKRLAKDAFATTLS